MNNATCNAKTLAPRNTIALDGPILDFEVIGKTPRSVASRGGEMMDQIAEREDCGAQSEAEVAPGLGWGRAYCM